MEWVWERETLGEALGWSEDQGKLEKLYKVTLKIFLHEY